MNILAVRSAIKIACLDGVETHPSQPQTHRDIFRLYQNAAAAVAVIGTAASELNMVVSETMQGPPFKSPFDPYATGTGKRRQRSGEVFEAEESAYIAPEPANRPNRREKAKRKAPGDKGAKKRQKWENPYKERQLSESDDQKADTPKEKKPLCANCLKRHFGGCTAATKVARVEQPLPPQDKEGENGKKGRGRTQDLSKYGPQKAPNDKDKGKTVLLTRIPCTALDCDTELCVCKSCVKPPISNRVIVSLSVPLVQEPEQVPARKGTGIKGKPNAPTATVALIDTGAKGHDFISGELADELASHGAKIVSAKGRVKTALDGEEIREIDSAIVVNYNFMNEETKQLETIRIKPIILDDLRSPLIIGLDTIHEHGLLG